MHEHLDLLLCTAVYTQASTGSAVHALGGCKAAHLVVHSFMQQVRGCSGSKQN